MSRRQVTAICLLALLGVPVVCWLCNFAVYRERNTYACPVCGSTKDEWQWRIGFWTEASIPLSQTEIVLHDSVAFEKLFSHDHKHRWVFSQGSPYLLGRWWFGCSLGVGSRPNRFSETYNEYPDFRELIDAHVMKNELTEATLRRLLSSDFGAGDYGHFVDAAAQDVGIKLVLEWEAAR